MYPYPASMPTEEIQLLLGKITGASQAELPALVQAGWAVQGYAQSQLLPNHRIAPAHSPLHPEHRKLLAAHLESALAGGAVDWINVLRIVTSLVQTWLGGMDIPPNPAPIPAK
jgi:hypothetical protein